MSTLFDRQSVSVKVNQPKRSRDFSDETWSKVAELLKSGMALAAICRIEGMPSESAIRRKRLFVPAVTIRHSTAVWQRVSELLAEGYIAKEISRMPNMPTAAMISRRCCSDPAFAGLATPRRQKLRGKLVAAIAALREGASIQEVTRQRLIISHGALTQLRRQSPALDQLIASFGAANRVQRAKQRMKSKRRTIDPLAAMQAVQASVSRSLPADVRGDVISMMLADLVAGTIALGDVERLGREYTNRHYRQFSKFGPTSLDAPAHRDGGRETIGDTVSVGMWG